MESQFSLPASIQRGFVYRREQPELPPRYTWQVQKAKYCPKHLPEQLARQRHEVGSFHGFVFCHRGLYERSMRIPENSIMAIENGTVQGLILHEIDMRSLKMRYGGDSSDLLVHWFSAHDEASTRSTSEPGRWSLKSFKRIMELNLVERRFNFKTKGFGSSYTETDEKVPLFFDLTSRASECMREGGYIQLDFRGKDLIRAMIGWAKMRWLSERILLKGYNLDYLTVQDLEEAYRWATFSSPNKVKDLTVTPCWAPYKDGKVASEVRFPNGPYIIMVFFPKPMVQKMLKDLAIEADSPESLDPSMVSFEDMCKSFEEQILGFVAREDLKMIPEIVHSGLGLGYNIETGDAVNPLNREERITELDVILESRIDRAMIEVSLKIREKFPRLYSSSCTRLCEVRLPNGDEYNASIEHGELYLKHQGEKGFSSKLRGIHGGLYPQSDLVVADDPFAEIAARTWIDEYKRLDRSQLLHMSYWQWIKQGGEELLTAVKTLNGPFLPNTWEGTLEDESSSQDLPRDDNELHDIQSKDDSSSGDLDDGKGSENIENDSALPQESEFTRFMTERYGGAHDENSVDDGIKKPRRKVVTRSYPDGHSSVESFIIESDEET